MKNQELLIREACDELLKYPQIGLKEYIKKSIKQFGLVKIDHYSWPNAMLTMGLEAVYEQTKNQDILKTITDYYDQWIDKGMLIQQVDHAMNGYTLIYLYSITKNEKYRKAIESIKQYLANAPKASDGSLLYRKNQKEIVYADTVGMVCPFLFRYGQEYNDASTIDLAFRQIDNFMKYSLNLQTGLPYHAYHAENHQKLGIIGWGRAVGWLLWGLESGITIESSYKQQLIIYYKQVIDASIKYLNNENLFSWQLPAMEGHTDTSGSGMILASMKTGINQGILHEEYKEIYDNGIEALEQYIQDSKVISGLAECVALCEYPQRYQSYPWTIAPAFRMM